MSFVYYPQVRSAVIKNQFPWLVSILLGVSLFLVCHWPHERHPEAEDYNLTQDVIVSDVSAGSQIRQVVLSIMGLAGVISLAMFPSRVRFDIDSLMGRILIAFLAWASISCIWAEDPSLTLKRLISFGIYCVVAAAVVRHLTLHQILQATFFTTALFLAVSIVTEIQAGALHPFVSGYRFSGTQHPNGEGIECGLLVLSGLAAARMDKHRRLLYGGGAAVGFVFLILTASRTALGATLLGNAVFLIFTASRQTRRRTLPALFILVVIVAAFAASGGYQWLESTFFPGRDESASSESFAGRTLIWRDVTPYILDHPIVGYGYGGFWTPAHISTISDEEKWGVPDSHSAYIDYLLALGAVGLTLYVLCLISGFVRISKAFQVTRDPHFLFIAGLLTFCAADGFLESSVGEGSLLTFLSLIALFRLGFVSREPSGVTTIEQRVSQRKVCPV